MYHSITFGDKNTYDDWHLIPSSRPYFAPPSVKTKILQIPGGSRRLDYTDTLLGKPAFGNRQGSIEFVVEEDESFNWNIIYEEILKYLHGHKMKAVLEDDPSYYYEGRFTVTSRKSDKYYPTIVIDYNVYPYKRELYPSDGSVPWDVIAFEPDMVIRDTCDITVNDICCLELSGSYEQVVPEFSCEIEPGPQPLSLKSTSGGFMCMVTKSAHTFGTSSEFWDFYDSSENDVTNEFVLRSGNSVVSNFKIGVETVHLIVLGVGTISILYRGGSL